jgi:hypothetical protein
VTAHGAEALGNCAGRNHEEEQAQEGQVGHRNPKQCRCCGPIYARTKTLRTIKGAMPSILGSGRRAHGCPRLGTGAAQSAGRTSRGYVGGDESSRLRIENKSL